MAYKSLLTISSDLDGCDKAFLASRALTEQGNAHLDVIALGIDYTQPVYFYGQGNALITQDMLIQARESAKTLESTLRDRLQPEVFSWSCDSAATNIDGISRLVSMRARFADLVILPKPYGEGRSHADEAIVEAALFDGHAPVLIVPETGHQALPPKCVTIAWNQSAEALAAIRAAMPFLKTADLVSIVIIDPPQHAQDRSDPGGALSLMLSRHGVRADISVLAKTMPKVSDIIARHVADINSDLLVMGAYGHSRFREALLGGATRDMLEETRVPVLMAR